ncbi:aspartate semialdehyde dehydrogenase [Candidatus Koribacter versatilis Ellin345]|uniref:Aspartate semialdehyde dehydrogenase n=1 Tax=Koribacter versatilis (strain Ellin345) TaxID=204669 RepID=Q1INQ9_KORVE|nr:aspartate-semialdehyde dehydrogenase [Candidatus Koribacter versatilis]ABF41491.1 aspartate semialdehyde dehydrogenase [Candidatus Koribacter versatilis Ellin345]
MQDKKIPIGILGATGMVGQRFIQLLQGHPWFEIVWLAASERSEGKSYAEAVRWRMKTRLPENIANMQMSPADPANAPKVIFAALDSGPAKELEPKFAKAGCAVVTNSSAFRMYPDVPLVVPEVNPDHIAILEHQQWRKDTGGYIVTNPNCCAIGLVMALAPLHQRFTIDRLFVSTMQAVSGAGYPGVPTLDILGNVIPYIGGEEPKLEAETKKLLGTHTSEGIKDATFAITAHCNRVPVEDGHTECVSLSFARKASEAEILDAWRQYSGVPQQLGLPSAPPVVLIYDERPERPQPRFDVDAGGGMTATIGRLRPCGLLDWKFVVLSHNTIRGAAGAAILNAELLKAKGFLS